jgi:polyisoprenoid-binding protein YceI
MRRHLSLTPLLSLLAALQANAVHARDWVVDPARSSLGFAGSETGNAFQGRFKRWQAQIAFDPRDPAAARVRVTIDIGSATTDERRRDEAMLGEDWLDAGRFPRAVFEATGFRPLGGGRFETSGTLAIRDQRRPVALSFVLAEHEGVTRARGEAALIRTQFGVGRGQWSGAQFVGLEVKVVFDMVARRAD